MVRTGYVDSVPAREAGLRGFEGLVMHKVREGEGGEIHLMDICRGVGPLLPAALEAEHPGALAHSPVGTAWQEPDNQYYGEDNEEETLCTSRHRRAGPYVL